MGEVEGQVRSEHLDAEREARRRAALAQVRQYPDPVLRMRANDVEADDESVGRLVERMTRLMQEARGVGLAAPQIGVLRRVLVYQTSDEAPTTALVNPRVTRTAEERESAEEGCLSLGAATVVVPVERPVSLTVEAVTPEGEPVTVEADGLEARVIQHELDHLDGVLIVDRTTPDDRREALGRLRPQPILGPLA
ncbi:MAG TPA: peptide deformylase [Gaiellaceae bacterium]|nr:peptide deformylase [Gaiellaceae bacterium]